MCAFMMGIHMRELSMKYSAVHIYKNTELSNFTTEIPKIRRRNSKLALKYIISKVRKLLSNRNSVSKFESRKELGNFRKFGVLHRTFERRRKFETGAISPTSGRSKVTFKLPIGVESSKPAPESVLASKVRKKSTSVHMSKLNIVRI